MNLAYFTFLIKRKVLVLFNVLLPHINKMFLLYMDKMSVYCLDPLNFRCFYSLTSALLRGLQKMAASKPISWLYLKKTSLLSLNNNFGTFNSCSGLFPFRHTTLSYYVRLFKIHHCPSESKFSPIKSSRFPDVYKTIFLSSSFRKRKKR